jgi:hypothetical protein
LTISRLFARPFREGFVPTANELALVLIDYRWDDGFVERRWLANPKKVDLSLVVFKPCGTD